jgi:5'-nucleotidase
MFIKKVAYWGIIPCAFFAGCQTAHQAAEFQEPSRWEAPLRSQPTSSNLETLAIIGTNDLHGNLSPIQMKTDDTLGQVSFSAGGVATLSAYIDILRSEFGDHLIWLDAGDEFQGTLESNPSGGASVVQFFNFQKLTAASIGNHEFDFGIPSLKARMKEAQYPFLAANILNAKTGERADFPNTLPHQIVTAGNLKVGILGLSTLDTPKTTRAINVQSLKFENLKAATLREVEALRKKGAQIILLTAHVGVDCPSNSRAAAAYQMRKPTDFQESCNNQDEMVQLLESLPPGTVDAVVTGHSHTIVHHWIAGVPVVQAGSYGRYLNVIYLSYDPSTRRILPDETRIEGPVPVCAQVFQNQNDCNGDRHAPKMGRGPLVTPRFHGKSIVPSEAVQKLIQPIIEKADQIKSKPVGVLDQKLSHLRSAESPLGNLIADAARQVAKTDFAMINSGGIRAPLQTGTVTYGDIFRTMPFDNAIAIMKVTGQELLNILRVAESGSRGLASVSGLSIKLIDLSLEAPVDDLSGDGKLEIWETNRILEVRKSNGEPIDPNGHYTLATLDFLVLGGDDLKWPMSKVPMSRIQLDIGILVRDALLHFVEKNSPINTESHPLLDPTHPRISFGHPPSNKKEHHTHRKNRKKRTVN